MAARGASLAIDFKVRGDHSLVNVHSPDGASLTARGELGRAELVEFHTNLNRDLLDFQRHLGHELQQEDWEAVAHAVRILFIRGRLMCKTIFGDKLNEAQSIFRQALPLPWEPGTRWRQIDLTADFRTAPPFEFLPILDLSEPSWRLDSIEALSTVLARFLGFSAIIRRIFTGRGGLDQSTEIDNTPRLNLKFFQHVALEGSKHELAFLAGNQDAIACEGPWPPDEAEIDDAVGTFARHLWDPTLHFDQSVANRADHFHHFSCHCDTSGDTSEQHYLLLASDRATCKASIRDVKDRFVAFEIAQGSGPRPVGPIVFLNACATAKMLPTGISSFASLFLHDNRNRAVIGTETVLSDAVAAAFAKVFYRRLLEGHTLGEAIQLAKWCLVRTCNNPVALIYTMYANPDIKVTQCQICWRESDDEFNEQRRQ